MDALDIAIADPTLDDVRGLVEHHLKFGRLHSPPQDAHALEVDGLLDPAVNALQYPLPRGAGRDRRAQAAR